MRQKEGEGLHPYQIMAKELMEIFDSGGPVPPTDKISGTIRGEMAVMRFLERENRKVFSGEISKELHMSTSRVAAVLNSLQKKGLLERTISDEDRRRVSVSLTQEGKDFCMARKEEAIGYTVRIMEELGKKDAREFLRLVRRLHEIMPRIGPPCPYEEGEKQYESE